MWCLSESTVAFFFLCLKFGLEFSLDPNEQGTRWSSLRFEMPSDEVNVSPVALDAEWDPGPPPCPWVEWNPAPGFLERKRLPGSWRAVRVRWGNVGCSSLGIHNACRRIVVEPRSRQDLENMENDL